MEKSIKGLKSYIIENLHQSIEEEKVRRNDSVLSLHCLATATEILSKLDNIDQQICTSPIISHEESTGQHPDEIKINSPQLDEELENLKNLKKLTATRIGGVQRLERAKKELLSIKDSYNLTPAVLKDVLTISLMEDELLHTLKKY